MLMLDAAYGEQHRVYIYSVLRSRCRHGAQGAGLGLSWACRESRCALSWLVISYKERGAIGTPRSLARRGMRSEVRCCCLDVC